MVSECTRSCTTPHERGGVWGCVFGKETKGDRETEKLVILSSRNKMGDAVSLSEPYIPSALHSLSPQDITKGQSRSCFALHSAAAPTSWLLREDSTMSSTKGRKDPSSNRQAISARTHPRPPVKCLSRPHRAPDIAAPAPQHSRRVSARFLACLRPPLPLLFLNPCEAPVFGPHDKHLRRLDGLTHAHTYPPPTHQTPCTTPQQAELPARALPCYAHRLPAPPAAKKTKP